MNLLISDSITMCGQPSKFGLQAIVAPRDIFIDDING